MRVGLEQVDLNGDNGRKAKEVHREAPPPTWPVGFAPRGRGKANRPCAGAEFQSFPQDSLNVLWWQFKKKKNLNGDPLGFVIIYA